MKSTSVLRGVMPRLFGLWLVLVVSAAHAGEDTIKIGILHSLSGTMAISESVLKDTVRMLIEDQNKKGGLLGWKLEAVIVDPASDWDLFAEKARELLTKEKVAVVFGCWTSASRKSVLPIFEQLNGLLFYPIQYEGEESSRNIFYTGATPNQQAIPAARYLMSKEGGEVRRWVIISTPGASFEVESEDFRTSSFPWPAPSTLGDARNCDVKSPASVLLAQATANRAPFAEIFRAYALSRDRQCGKSFWTFQSNMLVCCHGQTKGI